MTATGGLLVPVIVVRGDSKCVIKVERCGHCVHSFSNILAQSCVKIALGFISVELEILLA